MSKWLCLCFYTVYAWCFETDLTGVKDQEPEPLHSASWGNQKIMAESVRSGWIVLGVFSYVSVFPDLSNTLGKGNQ